MVIELQLVSSSSYRFVLFHFDIKHSCVMDTEGQFFDTMSFKRFRMWSVNSLKSHTLYTSFSCFFLELEIVHCLIIRHTANWLLIWPAISELYGKINIFFAQTFLVLVFAEAEHIWNYSFKWLWEG